MRWALVVCLLLGACGPSVRTELRDARDAGAPPGELLVRWVEPPGPVGGQELVLRGDAAGGTLIVRRFRPGFLPADDAPEARLGHDAGASETADPEGDAERPSRREGDAGIPVTADAVLELVALLLEVEAWKAPPPPVLGPPLEAREATLELRVAGTRSVVRLPVADLRTEARLVRVRDRLLALAGAP